VHLYNNPKVSGSTNGGRCLSTDCLYYAWWFMHKQDPWTCHSRIRVYCSFGLSI